MGQTVNLLTYVFGGSNPSSPTNSEIRFTTVDWTFELIGQGWAQVRNCSRTKAGRPQEGPGNAEVAQLIEH